MRIFFILTLYGFAISQSVTVFSGRPIIRKSTDAYNSVVETLTVSQADAYRSVITKIGKDYYWASRENRLIVPVQNGAFPTFLEIGGSGVVRIIDPSKRKGLEVLKGLSSLCTESELNFDYVEIIFQGIKPIIYYGKFVEINQALLP